MRFEVSDSAIVGVFDDPNRAGDLHVALDYFLPLSTADRDSLFSATEAFLAPKKYMTQVYSARGSLVKFGQYLSDRDNHILPRTTDVDGWQLLILDWFSWYLVHSHETRKVSSRVTGWDHIAVAWMKALVAEEYLPDGLFFPRAKGKSQKRRIRSPKERELLGDESASITRAPIDKTIAGPLIWRSDNEYLDEVELLLRKRDQALRHVVDDYFLRLVKDYRSGKQLMRQVSDGEFRHRKENNDWAQRLPSKPGRATRVAHPDFPRSASWALRILKSELRESSSDLVFTADSLARHPAFPPPFMKHRKWTPIGPLLEKSALTIEQVSVLESRSLFMRFLGVLTTLDVAVATIILIQEHPNLTPHAVLNAKLIGPAGRSYVIATGDGRSTTFSVDKPRAGQRKYALLTPRAAHIIKHVIRATADVREALKRAGHSHWKNFFLGCPAGSNSRIGILRSVAVSTIVSSKKQRNTLAGFYPELEDAGIVHGVFSFKKLRATQAVLRWFDTGSISSASRALGNTYPVAMKHYVPEPIIKIWNDRIIRRFQNTLITLAAADEDYLLDATDIETLSDLQYFLTQLLIENQPGSSPIGNELHRRFDLPDTMDGDTAERPRGYSLLSIRLNSNSLAMLYAYRETTLRNLSQEKLDIVDLRTGLAPSSFIQLATMLQSASSSGEVSDVMRESLDIARLREIDSVARQRLPDLLRRFKRLRIDRVWSADG